jgi:hypothetical protein
MGEQKSPLLRPVRLAYQPPASSTFLAEQINHQQPASSTILLKQISTSHQPPVNRTGCRSFKDAWLHLLLLVVTTLLT